MQHQPQHWGPGGPGSAGCGGGPHNSALCGVTPPPCPYVVQSGGRAGFCCSLFHAPGQCFAQLTDRVCAQFGLGPTPDWAPLARSHGLALWDLSAAELVDALDFVSVMYADVDYSAAGSVCSRVRSLGYLSVASVDHCLSSLGASVSALGACVATSPGAPTAEASLSFTLDSGVSQCFFRDHTTLTPLLALVPIALVDPTSGPAVARSSTTLLCPVVPFGVLRGHHIPSFTRNLSVSYYTRYPCRGLPVPPPPPLFLAPSPPPAPAPPVPPPPRGLAPSGVSHATPLPSVAHQVASPQSSSQSPQQPLALPRQVTVDYGGVGIGGASFGGAGVGGTDAGGANSEGDGAEGVGAGGTTYEGAGAEATGAGGARSGDTCAGGAGTGGASSGGARPRDTSFGGAGARGSSS
ncbi:unnamed protein product [Closterium sp. NIES-54]